MSGAEVKYMTGHMPWAQEPQSSWLGRKKIKSVLHQSVIDAIKVALRKEQQSTLRCGFCVIHNMGIHNKGHETNPFLDEK